MTNRESITTILIGLGILALAGCGSDSSTDPAPAAAETPNYIIELTYLDEVTGPWTESAGHWNVRLDRTFPDGTEVRLEFDALNKLRAAHSLGPAGSGCVILEGIPAGADAEAISALHGEPVEHYAGEGARWETRFVYISWTVTWDDLIGVSVSKEVN